jgi:hypothetical protein
VAFTGGFEDGVDVAVTGLSFTFYWSGQTLSHDHAGVQCQIPALPYHRAIGWQFND